MIEKIAFSIPGNGAPVNLDPVGGMPSGGDSVVREIIRWGITTLLVFAAILSLAFLIMGGIQWITSGGEKAGVEAARKKITYAIVGLVVVFLAFFIVNTVGNLFGVKLLGQGSEPHYTCSSNNKNGSCPAGQKCQYDSDLSMYTCLNIKYTCSSEKPKGTCPKGQKCQYDSDLGMHTCR